MAGIFDPNIFQGQGQFLFQVDQRTQPGGHYLTPEQVAALKKARAASDKAQRRRERKRKRDELAREAELRALYETLTPKPPESPRPEILKRTSMPMPQGVAAPPIDIAALMQARMEEDDIEVLLLAA